MLLSDFWISYPYCNAHRFSLSMYWDINRPASYDCLFNFILGARGVGKSYGTKDAAIKDYIKTGAQFVYVRRFKSELREVKLKKFFEDIEDKYPDHEFKVNQGVFYIDNRAAGYAVPLSTAKIEKSSPFPRVNKIIFDEFILDTGYHHYLPDEVTNFLELYSTIARDRTVKVWFLSNALSAFNPYFTYFKLEIPYQSEFRRNGDILVQMVKDNEYTDHMNKTRFGQLIAGTPYGNYAIGNEFLRDSPVFIEKKTARSICCFTLRYRGKVYGVWRDNTTGIVYLSKDTVPNVFSYSVTNDDMSVNTMLVKGDRGLFKSVFVRAYRNGCCRFETAEIKSAGMEIVRLCG